MADNNSDNRLSVLRPTMLGKPKADLSLSVAKASHKLFRVENGEVKVPRQRRTSEQWPEWFNELDAPKMLYFYVDNSKPEGDPERAIPVEYNEQTELFEHKSEDGTVIAQYTGDNVAEMADPDAREVSGTTEAIAQLQNAVTRFNTKTGKRLVVRFVKDERDKSGRTLNATRAVIRVR
jgi:hypothetical protein